MRALGIEVKYPFANPDFYREKQKILPKARHLPSREAGEGERPKKE